MENRFQSLPFKFNLQRYISGLSFPIGGLPKSQLREIAAAAGLPNAGRKDSQGICFLGKVKFSEFVAEHLVRLFALHFPLTLLCSP